MEIIYKEEAYAIVGACFEVYNEMGCGFVEPVYQECLELELVSRGVPCQTKQELKLRYKGRRSRPICETGSAAICVFR